MSSRLVGKSIWSVDDANRQMGRADGDEAVLVMWPNRNPCKPYITVPEGVYALVQVHGADLDYSGTGAAVWPAGFHYANPWTKVSHLVTKQNIVFATPIKGAKTRDDVSVQINVTIIFRIMGDEAKGEAPELVRTFVYNLGPSGLENQLRDAQEEAVRALARSVDHNQVYGLRSATYTSEEGEVKVDGEGIESVAGGMGPQEVTESMKKSLNDQFQRFGVEIIDVAITDVRLPDQFVHQMQEKTTFITVIAEQRMRQRFDMQKLRYDEEVETTNQTKREEQEKEKAEGEKLVAEVQKQISLFQAETRKLVAELQQRQSSEVLQIRAAGEYEVVKVQSRKESLLVSIDAAARATSEQLKAEKEAYLQQKESEAARAVAENNARANEILADAEGAAASKLRARRMMELQIKQLDVYRALASNKTLTVSGRGSDSLLADMLVAQRQSQVLLNVNTGAGAGGGRGATSRTVSGLAGAVQ